MKLDKQFFFDKILPVLITAICSALITILTNIIAYYTKNTDIIANPVISGIIGASLKTAHNIKPC